jgi:hypothetical protein
MAEAIHSIEFAVSVAILVALFAGAAFGYSLHQLRSEP